jgi:uncharacterized protein (DUF2235 family)
LTRDVSIKAIGVWDTVGSLGLPIRPFLQKVFGFASTLHRYRWYDTGISDKVENAFHALALDERRAAFDATVWEKEKDHTTVGQFILAYHTNLSNNIYLEFEPSVVLRVSQ